MTMLTFGLAFSALGVVLDRRADSGPPLPGDLLGLPVHELLTIAVFVIASILIGMSISFNVSALRKRRDRR